MIFIYFDKLIDNHMLSKSINGKYFGDIYLGKKSLRQSFEDVLSSYYEFIVITDAQALNDIEEPYFLWFSDVAIKNWDMLLPLCRKISYSSDCVEINCGSSTLYTRLSKKKNIDTLYLKNEDYLIQIESLLDIALITHSNIPSRFFNTLKASDKKLYKTSMNKEKIFNEYKYLSNIPDDFKHYFAEASEYTEGIDSATYAVTKYNIPDASILYLNDGLSGNDLDAFLKSIFHFIMTKQTVQDKSKIDNHINALLINKTQERLERLKLWNGYDNLNIFISEYTLYDSLEDISDTLFKTIEKHKKDLMNYPRVFSHGDLCLSNILYDKDNKLIKLIDPKGFDDCYLSSIYDISKLSHSVLGGYDFIVNAKSGIEYTADMRAMSHICIRKDDIKLFKQFLKSISMDYYHVRLVEASLFLSMLPLHIDNKRKVFLLALRAVEILNEVKK